MSKRKTWTADEVDFVRLNYATFSSAEIARTLSRTQESVRCQVKKIGLTRANEFRESLPGEIWKPVAGHEGKYLVSNLGRVRSFHRRRERLLVLLEDGGYWKVMLSKTKRVRVHRLVLETFVGPCPDRMEACHNNGDRKDNRVENLRWDSRKNNHADQVLHGTRRRGESHPNSFLTEEDVRNIRKLRSNGETLDDIGERFGVSSSQVSVIFRRVAWTHVA